MSGDTGLIGSFELSLFSTAVEFMEDVLHYLWKAQQMQSFYIGLPVPAKGRTLVGGSCN